MTIAVEHHMTQPGPRGCHGTNFSGKPCGAAAIKGTDYCLAHNQEARKTIRFGGPQPGAGRPAKPRAIDVLVQKIEADIDRVTKPLFDALDAEAEAGPDFAIRLRAVGELLDRAYGKPKQAIDVDHQGAVNLGVVFGTTPLAATDTEDE